MPLRHRPIKMCEYKADDAGTSKLSEKVLLYRLRELIKPQHVKAAEGVAMFTHDNPAPAVCFDLPCLYLAVLSYECCTDAAFSFSNC